MPRLSAPFYRPERDQWYVRHEGRRLSLNVRGKGNRTAAERAFRDLLAGRSPPSVTATGLGTVPIPSTPDPGGRLTLGRLLDSFLDAKAGTAPITLASYRWRVNNLSAALGRELPVTELTPARLERAVAQDRWSLSYRGDLVNLARMATRWALVNRLLPTDPLAGVKRSGGPGKRADVRLTPEDLSRLLERCDDALRGVVAFLHGTGARPCEARTLTAADVDLARGVVVLGAHKTARRTSEVRLIVVPEGPAREVLATACARQPEGPVFRRASGRPWTRTTLCHAFKRARAAAGLPDSLTPYTLRHLFCTDALTQGVPDATVAALVGHKSTRMLHAHYSHLLSRVEALAAAAGQVRGRAGADVQRDGGNPGAKVPGIPGV